MNIEDRNILRFEVLGVFSCGDTDAMRAASGALLGRTGRKALSFLQYIIVNHGRYVSSDELIGQPIL